MKGYQATYSYTSHCLVYVNDFSKLKVKLDEVDQANEIFETLMGEITEGRKNFIQENSLKVANLDI